MRKIYTVSDIFWEISYYQKAKRKWFSKINAPQDSHFFLKMYLTWSLNDGQLTLWFLFLNENIFTEYTVYKKKIFPIFLHYNWINYYIIAL